MTIEISGLSRVYHAKRGQRAIPALTDIDLSIGEGELFGILGPNGAGKTTLVRILTTLLTPSSGAAEVCGHDVVREMKTVRRMIGVAFGGERGLYDRLSARDNLLFAAQLYDVPRRDVARRVNEVLDLVDLHERADSRVETFSRGMKQRLHIARALIHDPAVVFLDEPSSGLDPVAARSLRDLTKELQGRGKTILITTHEMFEADILCDRVAVLVGGRVRQVGSPDDIKSSVTLERVIEVEVRDELGRSEADVRALDGVSGLDIESRGPVNLLSVRVGNGSSTRLVDVLRAIPHLSVGSSLERTPTLEDAYVAIVEEQKDEVVT
ncbi:ABC transporter ATP-binding protein [Leifsonia sp. fls2-241-R2A-40a]|uniref:ABC transporter ATP-binding protein n=1 Tax=Leifsonia sp. fls2-241-R2A-40a TaxID=3040290 RepID=UPI00254EC226|nr:ABC transporter ATP-binding protein [Leifsonia sp. fls2-241-R2A-40a]